MQGVQVAQLLIPSPQGERKCHYIPFRCKKLDFFSMYFFLFYSTQRHFNTNDINDTSESTIKFKRAIGSNVGCLK